MSLSNLPNELLLRIAWYVLKCPVCYCPHVSRSLSALARCSHRLHSALKPDLLRSAIPGHMLLWAITHAREDTVTLAITHGADPNVELRETHFIDHHRSQGILQTPLDIAIILRLRSGDPRGDQPQLDVCNALLRGGGIPSTKWLTIIVESGDEDLLRCCLPYLTTEALAMLDILADREGSPPLLFDEAGEPVVGAPRYEMVAVRILYHGWRKISDKSLDDWGPWCGNLDYQCGYKFEMFLMELVEE